MRFLVVLLASVGVAHAEPRRGITLADAVAAAKTAPAVLVGGHEIAAADAQVDAAGAWPAPSVHVATNRLTARLVAGATLPLPVFGTVGAAQRHAAAEAESVRADVDVQRRDIVHRIVIAWIGLARADGEVTATSIAAQHAAELELIAKGRLSAGVGGEVDVTVASAARARADVAAAAAVRDEDAAGAQLAGLLGWDPAQPLRSDGGLVTGEAYDLDALRTRLAHHPERAAALRRVEASETNLDVVLSQRWPTLALEGEIAYDDRTAVEAGNTAWDRTDAMVGVALELPIFSHNGDKARAARAQEAAERARLAVTETTLGAGLQAAYRTWQAATERLHSLERDVGPAQERAAALSAQAFREGARDLASALQAARDLDAVRAEINNARADAAAAFADLQLAVGDEVGRGK
jgi:cobalt-zinc-cadmium efflux system outer membrane protein